MKKITLIALLTSSMITISSAEMFGGMMSDMMDIPKEMITSGTDAMRDMKDAAKDSADAVKDAATDVKDSAKDVTKDAKDATTDVSTDANKSTKAEAKK